MNLNNNLQYKICHLSSAHKWFDERIFQKECKSLAKAGYAVVLIIPKDQPATIDAVRIVPLPVVQGKLARLLLMGKLFLLALRENASLYHFHDPELILVGICLNLAGKKVFYDVHEDYKQSMLSRKSIFPPLQKILAALFTNFEQFANRFFDRIVVVDSNIQSKFPVQKTELITNFPPAAVFSQERSQSLNGKFHIVFLGALTKLRGAISMIDALNLSRHKQDIELDLIGTVAEPELEALLSDNKQIIYHGRVPWEQTYQMLADADVGLFLYQPTPAHWHFTGEGNTKLFEYMGSGLPIIYSDFPKLRKLIEPVGCGIPVDPTDPQKIAEAIDKLYENPELRAALGAKGRLAVQEQYNWEIEEQKLLKVYSKVLSFR